MALESTRLRPEDAGGNDALAGGVAIGPLSGRDHAAVLAPGSARLGARAGVVLRGADLTGVLIDGDTF